MRARPGPGPLLTPSRPRATGSGRCAAADDTSHGSTRPWLWRRQGPRRPRLRSAAVRDAGLSAPRTAPQRRRRPPARSADRPRQRHTHLIETGYSTPRLIITSPVPESGKTTVLEHLERLCLNPLQIASLGSPALVARVLSERMTTLLIDEVQRNLDPKRDGVGELLSVINSGYKRGGTRPVLVPDGKKGWTRWRGCPPHGDDRTGRRSGEIQSFDRRSGRRTPLVGGRGGDCGSERRKPNACCR
jgi:hypothetical protein